MRSAAGLLLLVAGMAAASPLAADDDAPSPEELKALASSVKDYETKFRLIEIGCPAARPLLVQLDDADPWLVFESKSALRWIVGRARGNVSETQALIDSLAASTAKDRSRTERTFAAELLGDLEGERSIATLGSLLDDEAVREAALDSLQRLRPAPAGDAIVAHLGAAPVDFRSRMIRALGRRREGRLLPRLVEAIKEPGTRIAAIEAIGLLGDPAGVAALSAGLRSSDAEERSAAYTALVRIADAASAGPAAARLYAHAVALAWTDDERITALEGLGRAASEDALSAVEDASKSLSAGVAGSAFRALVSLADARLARGDARGAASLYDRVLRQASDDTALMRALAGLSRIGSAEAIAAVKRLLAHPSRKTREAAVAALGDIVDEGATNALVSALESPSSALVLEALGRRRDASALPAISRLASTGDAAAIRALGAIGDSAAAAVLLEAVKRGDPGSVEAYLQVAETCAGRRPAEARAMYHEILELVPTARALSGLARVCNGDSSARVERILDADSLPDDVRAAAISCLVSIGDGLAARGDRDEAVRVYARAFDLGGQGLEDKLRNLGHEVEITAREGRVDYWWMIGPFSAVDVASWTHEEFPEKEIDLSKTYRVGDRDVRWRSRGASDESGVINLESFFEPHDDVAIYASCELVLKKEHEVTFKCGSDDGIIVWVNGERVHAFLEPRPLKPDEDVFKAKLGEGVNTLLVKVAQTGGGWGLCLRALDEEGLPLKFKMR